jgi:hypothetical protein
MGTKLDFKMYGKREIRRNFFVDEKLLNLDYVTGWGSSKVTYHFMVVK